MILYMFSVKDSATEQFSNPMFMMANGQAIRGFSDEVNKQDAANPLFLHPDDYSLYSLGEFDTSTGSFSPKSPELLVRGKDVKSSQA